MKRKVLTGMRRGPAVALLSLACLIGALARTGTRAEPRPVAPPVVALPERPPDGEAVPAGAALQPLIDAAPDGAVFCLSPGVYAGPLVIRRPVTLWGPREAVVRSAGTGSTVVVTADGARLLGFTVDGSGDRPDLMDAGVLIRAADVRVEGLCVVRALFGIAAEKSRRVAIVGNEIRGDADTPCGLRGDAIRLWETRNSVVANNRVTDSRDILIWYAPDNQVLDNVVEHGRYGTHFMYSSGALVRGNRYVGNTVGVFVMYSRNIQIRDNLMAAASDAGGMGIGLKESGNVTLEGNRVVHDHTGLYMDRSPFQREDTVTVRRNLFALCQTGVLLHASQTRGTFTENSFRGNRDQVAVEGRGDALAVTWEGNAFDDYQGYDLDRDGVGDVPYELRSLSNQVIARTPEMAFFRGSPALSLVESISHIFPLFRPQPILVDRRPLVGTTEYPER